MGFVLRFLSGPLGGYALIAVVFALVGSLSYARIQHANSVRYQIERNAAQDETHRLIEAVKSKDALINDLTNALNAWQRRAEASVKESTEAGERAATYQTQLTATRSRLRALTEIDRGNPKCEALLEIDLGAVCTGHADRVRKWSAGDLQGASDSSSSANGTAH